MATLETPRGTIAIRASRADDAAPFSALRLQAMRDHPEAFGSDYESNVGLPLEHWQKRLTPTPTVTTFLALAGDQDQLVGMTVARRDEGVKLQHNGSIQGVYVHPDWRGLGILDALMTAALDLLRKQGVLVAKLSVNAVNTAAMRAYVRHGFSVYGVEPMVLYVNGVYYDELLMAKRL